MNNKRDRAVEKTTTQEAAEMVCKYCGGDSVQTKAIAVVHVRMALPGIRDAKSFECAHLESHEKVRECELSDIIMSDEHPYCDSCGRHQLPG